MKNMYDCYTLSNGTNIPCIGFGTYKTEGQDNCMILSEAIRAGYRYFDTASFYGTEKALGKAIEKSEIPREEFFITSKVWKTEMGYKETKEAFKQSLERMNMTYLDQYLIHWPKSELDTKNWKKLDIETWKALEDLYHEKKVKTIGLSNFLPHHIDNILESCSIKPMVNQLEVHPGYAQEVALNFCEKHSIRVQGWSPIGRMRVVEEPLIQELAIKYNVSAVQVCLRFSLQKGVIPLPKSSTYERMKQNQDIFSFQLSKEDMYRLETLPQTGWSGEHPDRERIAI